MVALLEEALDAGALGLSTGLFTPPGAFAPTEEIIALAHVLRRHGGRYFSHLRDEANRVFEAFDEAVRIGAESRRPCPGRASEAVGARQLGPRRRAARPAQRGARGAACAIDCDQYPYTAASNPLKNLLPRWIQTDRVEAMVQRLADPAARDRIRREIAASGPQ